MINSFVYSNFNYCPLVWHFCTCESSQKMEKIKKCCLRLVLYDSKSDYGHLIQKNGTTTMEIKKLRTSVTELFKTISNINPSYMKNMFTLKTNAKIWPHDIIVRYNTATYGNKSLTALGPKTWNKLPTFFLKSLTSITKFKGYKRTWFGPSCKCNVWSMVNNLFIYLFLTVLTFL